MQNLGGQTKSIMVFSKVAYSVQHVLSFQIESSLHTMFLTRRSISEHWVACGTCYSKTEGTELGGSELQRSSQFFQVWVH